jgi:hypothetical protein
MGHHTALSRLITQRKDGITGTTRLECANLLKILTLKENFRTNFPIDEVALDQWRTMDVWLDTLVSGLYVGERNGHS